jgi:hypothetical protein
LPRFCVAVTLVLGIAGVLRSEDASMAAGAVPVAMSVVQGGAPSGFCIIARSQRASL